MKKEIKVFSTPTCPYCVLAKNYLTEKGVTFEDIDVSKDREQAKAMIQKSGQMGVPQIWIDGQVIVGYDRHGIDKALSNKA